MRTTVTIDNVLYQRALEMAEPGMHRSDIFREAMVTLCGCGPPSVSRP